MQWIPSEQKQDQAIEEVEKRTHSNHPMRHLDRTCPACVGDDIDKMLQALEAIEDVFGPLYLAPPKREWVSLTDEEIADIANSCRWSNICNIYPTDFAHAIEAKLREKNT